MIAAVIARRSYPWGMAKTDPSMIRIGHPPRGRRPAPQGIPEGLVLAALVFLIALVLIYAA